MGASKGRGMSVVGILADPYFERIGRRSQQITKFIAINAPQGNPVGVFILNSAAGRVRTPVGAGRFSRRVTRPVRPPVKRGIQRSGRCLSVAAFQSSPDETLGPYALVSRMYKMAAHSRRSRSDDRKLA